MDGFKPTFKQPTIKLTKAQLFERINKGEYETLDTSTGECADDGVTYKIDGFKVEIIDD